MKNIVIIFFLFLSLSNIKAQTSVELYFYDACKDSVLSLEYELYNYKTSPGELMSERSIVTVKDSGEYYVSSAIVRAGWYALFDILIGVSNIPISDTLEIPNLTLATTRALHSSEFTYLNCSKNANGHEEDYRKDGTLRMTGDFLEGKPFLISKFNNSGVLIEKQFYSENGIIYNRVEYYHDNGELWFYEVYRTRKKRTIILTYDEMGKLEDREVIRHSIVEY